MPLCRKIDYPVARQILPYVQIPTNSLPLCSFTNSVCTACPTWTDMSYFIRGDVRRFLSLRVGDELNPKFMFSSGQRRVAGLAFLLAVHLSRSSCRLNSLVLDDPVQHIDDYRALHLVEVLHAIRRSGRQVICTVEDEALASLLCRRLQGPEGEEGALLKMTYLPNSGVTVTAREQFASLPKISIFAA
jgi:chromosome segregation protein